MFACICQILRYTHWQSGRESDRAREREREREAGKRAITTTTT